MKYETPEITKLFMEFTKHIDSFLCLAAYCYPENADRKTRAGEVVERILEKLGSDSLL